MRNVTYVGLCWVMTLALVAVALGQQVPATGQAAPTYSTVPPASQAPRGQPAAPPSQRNDLGQPLPMPAPGTPQDRSLITGTYQSGQPAMNDSERRGELGVWMGESGGPGVRILRVTSGSAAAQAGLRVGDVILQVNGRGATSPPDTARLIRQVGVGETVNLTVWRDGNQQQMQVALKPARESARGMMSDPSHEVGFGRSETGNSDLASRTIRLEQQINSLTQELSTLRQELAQLRTSGPVQTGFNADASQGAPPQEPAGRYNETLKPATSGPTRGTAPPTADAAKPAAEPPKPAAPAASPPAPAAEKASDDLFGSASAPAKAEEKPKTEEQPKPEEKPKADDKAGSDDLFK